MAVNFFCFLVQPRCRWLSHGFYEVHSNMETIKVLEKLGLRSGKTGENEALLQRLLGMNKI
jgi:hypothetical protein